MKISESGIIKLHQYKQLDDITKTIWNTYLIGLNVGDRSIIIEMLKREHEIQFIQQQIERFK